MAEYKKNPSFQIKAESSGRVIAGICSVFGNVDDWRDRMWPGSFTKTLNEGRDRAVHLWNHNSSLPPTASIVEIKEVGRPDLPPEVIAYAPTATGGLYVKRDYYVGNEWSEWIFGAIQKQDIREMSFGFDPVKYEYTVEDEKEIRELREVKLYDTSDVPWGMNNATFANIKSMLGMDADAYFMQLPFAIAEFQKNFKAGRRNAAADMQLITSIHQAVKDLGFDDCMEKPADESEKSAKGAEAVIDDTSLQNMRFQLMALELETLIS